MDTSEQVAIETANRAKRRRRSVEEKRRIVEETREAGASVERVARRHKLRPDQAYSPASIAKSYLDAMNIVRPKEHFRVANRIHGISMQAYYGGRAECRIRKTPVPVKLTDSSRTAENGRPSKVSICGTNESTE